MMTSFELTSSEAKAIAAFAHMKSTKFRQMAQQRKDMRDSERTMTLVVANRWADIANSFKSSNITLRIR